MNVTEAQMKDAKSAAGLALLHHVSPQGGSWGSGLDEPRAEKVAVDLTGEELFELLTQTALEATRPGWDSYRSALSDLLQGAKLAATKSDSLTLWLFIKELKAKTDKKEEA